jgi:hypothetical protein
MRPLYLLVIVSIFGAMAVLAVAMILTSPVLIPAPAAPASPTAGDVKYAPDAHLPGPHYYTGIDFDTLRSDDHLTVIPIKSFRQQVTNYSCGPVAAMTVLSYYGQPAKNTDADELRIVYEMNTSDTIGTNPEQMAAWFNRQGWNATWGNGGNREMLRENLKNGIPTMVEWMDWGGHWVVVVGYDTRGTETIWDDVIIFADSVDCHDDRVDGITYFNYGEFDAMWFDAHYFPEKMRVRAYVVATPGTSIHPS